MATVPDVEVEDGGEGSGVWWNDADAPEGSEAAEDDPPESSDVWFEELLKPTMRIPLTVLCTRTSRRRRRGPSTRTPDEPWKNFV